MAETRSRDLADLGVDATGLATDAELTSGLASKPTFSYGTATPTADGEGAIWYDENDTPPTPKYWDGSAWQPFSSGLGYAVISSPAATGNYTDGNGDTWDYYAFDGSGTITFSEAGLAQVFLISGGAGSAAGADGSGGRVMEGIYEFDATSYTVTVGAGGPGTGGCTSPGIGGESSIGTVVRSYNSPGFHGGAGAGASRYSGRNNDYTGSTITYGNSGAFPPTANRGDGRNGTFSAGGSSGRVIVRVKT